MPTESFAFLVSDVSRLIRRRFDARARAFGVSRAQWQVLIALSRNEGINQTGLADYLEVETITLCRMIDRLAEAGLVERRADPADRRAWRLHLTAAAHPLIVQLKALGEDVVAESVAGVDPSHLATTVAALNAIRTNLSSRAPDVSTARPSPATAEGVS